MAREPSATPQRPHEAATGPVRADEGELNDIHPAGTVRPIAVRRSIAGRFDHLTPLRRALLMVLATIGAVVAVAGLVATAHGLQQMLWELYDVR